MFQPFGPRPDAAKAAPLGSEVIFLRRREMRSMSKESRLVEATESGEVVKIRYHGGSQPGALREIAPISVSDGKVRARCFESGAIKLFTADRIEIVDSSREGERWSQDKFESAEYLSLSQLLDNLEQTLRDLGLHLEASLDGDEQWLTLHRCFKNGKPLKAWDVALTYEKYAYDMVIDWESNDYEVEATPKITGERQRPWSVSAKNETTRSYGSLDKAAVTFSQWANTYAPSKGSQV
jgi:hypothetical protein